MFQSIESFKSHAIHSLFELKYKLYLYLNSNLPLPQPSYDILFIVTQI